MAFFIMIIITVQKKSFDIYFSIHFKKLGPAPPVARHTARIPTLEENTLLTQKSYSCCQNYSSRLGGGKANQPETVGEVPLLNSTTDHNDQKTRQETQTKEQNSHPIKTNSEIGTQTYNHSKFRCLDVNIRHNQHQQRHMSPPKPNYPTIASLEYSIIIEAQENDLKSIFIKMTELKRKLLNSLKKLKKKQTKIGGNE